ncbi:MAG: glycosyltransferase [Clostridia bacterium]|nr:glycosyltransferase [Clostridia bacterium]
MSVSLQIQSVIYHNEKDSLLRAMSSLANAVRVNRDTTGELGQVTVIYGDASKEPVYTDAEVAELGRKFADYFEFKYVFFNENTGTAKGHNRLGALCNSEYIMIMNPDIVVSPRLFSGMIAPLLDQAQNVGLTEARQTPVEHPKEYDTATLETDWASTACVIFSKKLFVELKGFDEDTFFMYCDDVDFSWRIRLLGKKVMYRPDCPVFHAKRLSANAGWIPTKAEIYYSAEAALLMAYKWSDAKRVKVLLERYANDGEIGERVVARFNELKEAGKLPTQLDPTHQVAKFINEDYSERRFSM